MAVEDLPWFEKWSIAVDKMVAARDCYRQSKPSDKPAAKLELDKAIAAYSLIADAID